MDTLSPAGSAVLESISEFLDPTVTRRFIETLEIRSAKILLMSSNLSDVYLASRLLKCEKLIPISAEVVSHALVEGHEDIIRYLSTVKCFNFKEHAEKAFVGDLEVVSGDASWWDHYPISTFTILVAMYEEGLLQLDFPLAMENAIK